MGTMALMDVSQGESPAAKELESFCDLKTCNPTHNLGSIDSEFPDTKRSHRLLDTHSFVKEDRQDCTQDSMDGGVNIRVSHRTGGLSLKSVEQDSFENEPNECDELYRQLSSDYVDIFEILEEEIRAAEARELEEIQNNLLEASQNIQSIPTTGTNSTAAIGIVLLTDDEANAKVEEVACEVGFERYTSQDEAAEAVHNEKMGREVSGSEREQPSEDGKAERINVAPSPDSCLQDGVPQNVLGTRDFEEGKLNPTDNIKNDDGNQSAETWSEPAEDDEFNSGTFSGPIAFSGMLAYSGLISYPGQIPHSGNLSLHSDSSTSTRSFAFPILASEWNSSPAKIGQPDGRYFRRRRRWRPRFCCRRPATLFD